MVFLTASNPANQTRSIWIRGISGDGKRSRAFKSSVVRSCNVLGHASICSIGKNGMLLTRDVENCVWQIMMCISQGLWMKRCCCCFCFYFKMRWEWWWVKKWQPPHKKSRLAQALRANERHPLSCPLHFAMIWEFSWRIYGLYKATLSLLGHRDSEVAGWR